MFIFVIIKFCFFLIANAVEWCLHPTCLFLQLSRNKQQRKDSVKDPGNCSGPDGSEVVFVKDNVTIHPTQYAFERINGRLRLIKQGSSLFMVGCLPES